MLREINLFQSMAWWGHNLLLRASAEEVKDQERPKNGVTFGRSFKDVVYDHFLYVLNFLLGFVTYFYLLLIVLVFFFKGSIPGYFTNLIDSLSEPYLGAIGVYLFVKEIRVRRGVKPKLFGEIFLTLWLLFLFLASFLTFFSPNYSIDPVFNLILTNSLATVIIRLGTVLHF